jgi:endonuclease G
VATLGDKPAQAARRDIVPTTSLDLSQAMLGAFKKTGSLGGRAARLDVPGGVAASERQKRIDMRKDLLESPASDPTGYERIIGESDLTSINYLDRGRRAAAAVCRIRVPADGGEWYGTGFLVGPRLLLTNQHVLGNVSEASQAEAEFGYEHDVDGVLQRPAQFNLRPHEIFFTDPELDITFVAISPFAESGVPIERYGWLPLMPLPGKIVDKEWVTIIQHPGGGPKQISIRSSRIVSLAKKDIPTVNLDHFIHYLTDTEPGSSGSPVVNDQWQVIALHHKAVPKPHSKASDGKPAVYIGNEGVRVSAIYKTLERRRLESDEARRVLDRLDTAFGFLPITQALPTGEEDAFEKDAKPYAASRWKKALGIGYDPSFLSEAIPLQDICKKARESGEIAPLKGSGGDELTYHRFSVVVHKTRKFALLTTVNIHGGLLQHPGKRQSAWRQDERMDPEYQPAGDFYEKDKGTDKIQFSRGHLVRRLDPSWGETVEDAKLGDEDSFHYPNAAPQFQTYNDIDWGNLEDYVLDRAQTTEKKMTVFQGPIFRDDDPLYGKNRKGGPWKIPLSFWKIAVLEKAPGQIAAAAFMIGQTQYVGALYEAKVFSGLRPYRLDDMRSRKIQTAIKTIENETGLDFTAIRRFDAHGSLESTRQTRWINGLSDVLI